MLQKENSSKSNSKESKNHMLCKKRNFSKKTLFRTYRQPMVEMKLRNEGHNLPSKCAE